jgi:hypothetical protein
MSAVGGKALPGLCASRFLAARILNSFNNSSAVNAVVDAGC